MHLGANFQNLVLVTQLAADSRVCHRCEKAYEAYHSCCLDVVACCRERSGASNTMRYGFQKGPLGQSRDFCLPNEAAACVLASTGLVVGSDIGSETEL